MRRKYHTILLMSALLLCLFLLVGCKLFDGKADSAQKTLKRSMSATASPIIDQHDPDVDPIVIVSPTPVPGDSSGAQQLGLLDRTIIIENMSEQADSTDDFATVTLKLTFKNIGGKDINNLPTAYKLVGTEGDIFGLQSPGDSGYFGIVAAGSARSGLVVFQQIPSAATRNMQLFYHADTSRVVFAPLNIG